MAIFTKDFIDPYPEGWLDPPSEETPMTADVLQRHTNAIKHIEQYLADNPIESGGSSISVIDNLESTSATDALSANQGRALNERVLPLENRKGIYKVVWDIQFTNGIAFIPMDTDLYTLLSVEVETNLDYSNWCITFAPQKGVNRYKLFLRIAENLALDSGNTVLLRLELNYTLR